MTQKALLKKLKNRLESKNKGTKCLLENHAGNETIAFEIGYGKCLEHIIDLMEN